jgi:uncharacterized protein YecT (DUF1311 family)
VKHLIFKEKNNGNLFFYVFDKGCGVLSQYMLALLLIGTVLPSACLAGEVKPVQGTKCDDAHFTTAQYSMCLSNKVSALKIKLDESYAKALSRRPSTADDPRKTKQQLELSEKYWWLFMDANCKYYGGAQAGSSLWIGIYEYQCQLAEMEKRIDFLKNSDAGN